MRTFQANQVRTLIHQLSADGKREVSISMVLSALEVTDAVEKSHIRRFISHMVSRGELSRVRDGVFLFHPGKSLAVARNGEGYKRMWRIIRTENAGWTISVIAGTTRMSESTVTGYCRWLENEGFIARIGKKGNARLFRATQKAKEHLATPYPPIPAKDPFAQERSAACRLVRLFMEANPGACREKIITECRAIIARFEKGESHVEQAN